ncbi:MAG: ComEC/Rec2 family competence protein [Nocardioidaceae bacterium]
MTREPLDLRLTPAALAAWSGAALGVGWSAGLAVAVTLVLLFVAVVLLLFPFMRLRFEWRRAAALRRAMAAALVVGAAALAIAGLRAGEIQAGPVPWLAQQRAFVFAAAVVRSDPVLREGRFEPYVVVRLELQEVTGRGATTRVHSPVLVIGDVTWLRVHLGDHVDASGRLQVPQGSDLSAVLSAQPTPQITARAGPMYQGIARVRDGLSKAAEPLPPPERGLVPALVDGDDSQMPAEVAADFKTTGLTHLLAVSGSNLTLVLGFVLFMARWCGVRARGLAVVGAGAVVFFVLLARPEPSVLRAAAMGAVGLAGLTAGGRRRGVRAMCVAVVVLVLADPWLARSVGFLLSTAATAGILLLASSWRDALSHWLPRPLAEALAVPLAAQVVCTPVIAAISGQVSLVAVGANLLVAPAVGPTTVAGLIAGLVAMVSTTVGQLVGHVAGASAWWIIWVAQHGAGFAGASVVWPVGTAAIAALIVLCFGLVMVMPTLLRQRFACVALAIVLVAMIVRPVGRPGWPPAGWVLVMCDVGQGDGMVLNAGHQVAVVVDTGPDPKAMDSCLDGLDIHTIALVVLTHFHADHVDGLPAVLDGRSVAEIEVSPLASPPYQAEAVTAWAHDAGVPTTIAVPGEQRRVGELRWRVLGPWTSTVSGGVAGADGYGPNNASVVMLVEVRGIKILLSGDAEPEEEDDILSTGADLGVDVFKVAHHGSANQDPAFVFATHARLALISVGANNDYGHPSPHTLGLLRELGAKPYRTDQDGDIAVIDRNGQLSVLTTK